MPMRRKEGWAMLPEDRLDTLLPRHIQNDHQHHEHMENGRDGREAYADLQPLLDASDRLTALSGAEPSPAFADRLETLFLATAASLSEHGSAPASFDVLDDSLAARFADTTPPRLGNDYPTLPGVRWDELDGMDGMDGVDSMDNQATVA